MYHHMDTTCTCIIIHSVKEMYVMKSAACSDVLTGCVQAQKLDEALSNYFGTPQQMIQQGVDTCVQQCLPTCIYMHVTYMSMSLKLKVLSTYTVQRVSKYAAS